MQAVQRMEGREGRLAEVLVVDERHDQQDAGMSVAGAEATPLERRELVTLGEEAQQGVSRRT